MTIQEYAKETARLAAMTNGEFHRTTLELSKNDLVELRDNTSEVAEMSGVELENSELE